MIIFHRDIPHPSNKEVLWHYMTLGNFIWMLQNRKLYFTRLDKFDDERDGIPTSLDLQYLGIDEEYCKKDRQRFFANCWICSDTEQYLMWNSYVNSREGIAIKTSVEKLMESAKADSQTAYLGKVSYIKANGSSQIPGEKLNVLRHSFAKRREFSSENEVRLLISSTERLTESHSESYSIEVNLETLIESVILHPKAPSYFLSIIKRLVCSEGLSANIVTESSLKRTNAK